MCVQVKVAGEFQCWRHVKESRLSPQTLTLDDLLACRSQSNVYAHMHSTVLDLERVLLKLGNSIS